MWRSQGSIIVSLEPEIGGEDLVGWKHTVGTMTPDGNGTWHSSKVKFHRTNEDGAWERKAEDDEFYASSTPSALKTFVALYDKFFIRTLLEYEGKVFNPITNETRVHYVDTYTEPLEETWIRITDDEEALARVWSNEFKKLAGAIVPVYHWYNSHDYTIRPQRSIWATISREYTAELGMETGAKLPPHLWTIIDPRTNEDIPIIDPAEEAAWLEKEYQQHVADLEEIERLNTLNEQREDYSAGIAYPEPEPAEETDWRVESKKFTEHSTVYMVGYDTFEFNPTLDDGTFTYDMSSLELIQDGLMKALLDVQRRISQQARDDVKEASQ